MRSVGETTALVAKFLLLGSVAHLLLAALLLATLACGCQGDPDDGDSNGGTGGQDDAGCTPVSGPFERRTLEGFPGPGDGPCGCETNETCVTSRIPIDETDEMVVTECVVTPSACSTDQSCCCMNPCASPLTCEGTNQEKSLRCVQLE